MLFLAIESYFRMKNGYFSTLVLKWHYYESFFTLDRSFTQFSLLGHLITYTSPLRLNVFHGWPRIRCEGCADRRSVQDVQITKYHIVRLEASTCCIINNCSDSIASRSIQFGDSKNGKFDLIKTISKFSNVLICYFLGND